MRRIFRRPVSYVITPALGISAILQIVMSGTPANGYSGIPWINMIMNLKNGNWSAAQNDATYLSSAMQTGVVAAIPTLIATGIAGILGRIFKV